MPSGAGLRHDPKRPARCGFFEHGGKLTPKDIEQNAEDQLEALLDPVLFATGFDADVLREVRSALSLLNRLYDDVPEQLARTLARIDMAEPWRATFVELTRALATVRDAGIGPANHRAPITMRSILPITSECSDLRSSQAGAWSAKASAFHRAGYA
jgi:hypothetical protein